jgi:aspartate ammonia-lyase
MKKKKFRIEHDTLGKVKVPVDAYYGAQTARATENFPISGIRPDPFFIKATAMVKRAAAAANLALGWLGAREARAIIRAADEIISGRLHDHFVVDAYQAGAGTSHNMNANEVIANRALEILGHARGEYSLIHPNDHVNMAQSTNDTFPTAMRIGALLRMTGLRAALNGLIEELDKKADEFGGIIKSGRTHLQDAVPVTLGAEFASYAAIVRSSVQRIETAAEGLKRIGLGGTAVGTGLNTAASYRRRVLAELRSVSGIRGLRRTATTGENFEALSSMGDFAAFSSALRDLVIGLTKIANDLRLLSSGPRTGIGEIKLPPVQPGSSIMPGKVNPVMAEMLNMVSFQVMGNDMAVSTAAQAGQFELNVMGPVINYNILQSMKILESSLTVFTDRCVKGIRAVPEKCLENFNSSVGLATILNPLIGYEKAAEVAKESERTGRSIRDVVIEKGIMDEKTWNKMMNPKRVTGPTRSTAKRKTKRKKKKA